MTKLPKKLILIGILLLAVIIRSYGIYENFNFTGEFGQNLLDIKNSIANRSIPFVGPATSHPWLYFGPLYYWAGILIETFGKSPFVFAWFGILGGVVVVYMNYKVIEGILGEKITLVSSLLISISPTFIFFSRQARFYSFVLVLFYPLVWTLFKIWKGFMQYIFWSGLIFGLIFSFHYSPLIFLPIIFIVLWKKHLRLKNYFYFIAGALLPNTTLLLWDLKNGLQMTKNLLLWVPYRFIGFLGFYPKNNVSSVSVSTSISTINQFFGQIFVQRENLWFLFTFIVLAVVLLSVIKAIKAKSIDFFWLFTIISLASSLVAGVVLGDAPLHYYLPVFPIPILVFSWLIVEIWHERIVKIFVFIAFVSIFVLNIQSFFGSNLYFRDPIIQTVNPLFIPFKTQMAVAKIIVDDSKSRKFTLTRVGSYDYFDQNYSQNYRYLMWVLGNEPVKFSSLNYIIYEQNGEVSVLK